MKSSFSLSLAAVAVGVAMHLSGQTRDDCTQFFVNWPAEARPSSVSRRMSMQFLSTVPDFYKPEGYRGKNGGYGFGREIQYSVVSLWVNALECARLTGDRELEDRLIAAFEPYFGIKKDILPKFKHVDFTVVGAVPLEIAILCGDERARSLGLKYADMQWEKPRPDDPPPWYNRMPYEERLSWWSQGYSDQTRLWIDDTYMISALQTQAYRLTGDMKYLDRAAKEAVLYLDRLQQPNGLFHHAPGVPFFWGRGNGWMAATMPLILRYLPESHPDQARIMDGYRRMMATLLSLQREDGLWGQLVDDAESWSESSASAMFAYAFAEGAARGWLDGAAYGAAMRKAYLALVARLDRFANIADVCDGTCATNDREFYLRRPHVNGDPHGQAAMMWVCRAILECARGRTVLAADAVPQPEFFPTKPHYDLFPHRFELVNRKTGGFRGIWYGNQPSGDEYVYKYSGGLGTYCAGHVPMAVYSKEADKTFFTYGGTDERNTTLLQCVSYFDHKTGKLARPTVVFDKHTVDAHDNAVINIDDKGHVYVFSSSHGRHRPSAIAKSVRPYDISKFKVVWEGNFSYPQPFYFPENGFLLLHTWYLGDMLDRSNCLMSSDEDGTKWSGRERLVYFNDGHYQRAWQHGGKVGVAFDQHPKGKGLNWRTDVFYMESDDFGRTWSNVRGEKLQMPLSSRDNPALAVSYADRGRNVYIKGVKFDSKGRPVVLSTVSKGYRAGAADGPRKWMLAKWTGSEWREIDTGIESDNNYDFAELYVDTDDDWRIIGASETGPQPYNPGGEIAAWASHDGGETWVLEKRLTSASSRNQNYPRQPLNVNGGFYAFWTDGDGRKPSVSRLYFCDKSLNVYEMPAEFEGEFADPVPYRAGEGRLFRRDEFQVRDPFVLAEDGVYYLYESKPWNGGNAVFVRTSRDLESWSGSHKAMTVPDSVPVTAVWAPEVHKYNGSYYMFVTLTERRGARPVEMQAKGREAERGKLVMPRGTWVFRAESPLGPFEPVSDGPATPADWMALDGTLVVEDGRPYMVFCHEWVQTENGRMCFAPLTDDLSSFASKPSVMFTARDAVPGAEYVTDGPFFHRSQEGGTLFMIWSNLVKGKGYCVLVRKSESGRLAGPWSKDEILFAGNGGHGMMFRTFEGRLMLTIHQPNDSPKERMKLFEVHDDGKTLRLS